MILVVENEQFHVHRLILSLNSPVFKAMFKSQFTEATADEIPLPGKKSNGVLDFLMKIYGPQYTKRDVEITLENVEQLLQLSDEYQVTEHIFKPCVKFLEDEPKTKENVMKIRALADLYALEKVHQDCDKLLSGMKLDTLSETVQFENIEKGKLEHFLTQRIKVLEGYLEELYPQSMGLLGCCLVLLNETKEKFMNWCTSHFYGGKVASYLDIEKCEVCRSMVEYLAFCTNPTIPRGSIYKYTWSSANCYYFDDNLPVVLEKFSQIMT